MTVFKKRLLLAVIPVLILLLSFTYTFKGPYSFGNNSDPEYCYLFNSLNILNLETPCHFDHPGTPVQVLGAMVLLGKGILNNATASRSVIQTSVLLHPEDYLRAINVVLNILIGLMAFWTGLKLYRHTGKLLPAFMLQFSLLCFLQVQVSLGRVSPEPFLVFTVLLLILVLIPEVFVKHVESSGKADVIRPVMAGAVLGLGLAAKVTFFPLLFFVFIFEGSIKRIFVAGSCILSFVLFTLPVLPLYRAMFSWFKNLLTHQGYYGQGPVGLPEAGTLLSNAMSLSLGEPFLILSLFFYFAGLLFIKYGALTIGEPLRKKIKKLLWIGCLVILAQIALTAKHPHVHYLLPSMVVTGILNAALIYLAFNNEHNNKYKLFSIIFVIFLVLGSVYNVVRVNDWIRQERQYASATNGLLNELKNFRQYNDMKVGFYRSSLPEFAVYFGNNFSCGHYGKELAQLYPDTIFYSTIDNVFYWFEGVIDKREIQDLMDKDVRFIMVGSPEKMKNKDWLMLEPVFDNGYEQVSRLVGIKR